MERHWIVDRIENGQAVLLRGDALRREPVCALPPGTKPGDALEEEASGGYRLDAAFTAQRQAQAQARLSALLRRRQD